MGSTAFFVSAFAMPAAAQDGPGAGLDIDDVEMVRITDTIAAEDLGRPDATTPVRITDDRTLAETGTAPTGTPEAYTGLVRGGIGRREVRVTDFLPPVAPDPQIVISNPGTSTTSRDPNNITGIGQMIFDQQNGFLGLCTGTLINPRTVLFAAHCVNDNAATEYGSGSGGRPIAFGFEQYLRNEAAGRPDELGQWYFAGANQYKTNVASSFFTVNQIRYNPRSTEAEANGFLYADIATATLDTPAAGIPTWAMLFSPLPNPGTATAAGTGYNVQIVGYGSHGNATTGSASGSDFRRRVAENIIGALTDLETFEGFLFGGPPNGLKQNLYFIDFDDPRRGLTGASPFDFNAFRDNARGAGTANPTEGTTASGDSGSPLILQNFSSRQLVAGVLSGGYTRFFNGQPANGYGTVSFYQPVYLYWDWIAANNPYRYVTNIAGDRNWTDAGNWVTTLDPNYFVIGPNGQVVNGVPTDLGQGVNGTGGDFGQICFESGGTSECYNTATGQTTVAVRPIGTDEETGAPGDSAAVINSAELNGANGSWIEGNQPEAYADGNAIQALPPATITNGLAGATNFVPNNSDPVRLTGQIGRYFDVTLVASGTTTLNTAVTIDRFMIGGAGSRLNITSTGSLTSLIDVRQMAGVMTVNGVLNSRGDFLLAGGGLMGTGRINAPFTTNVLATITPGTETTIGTLTFGGNLVLSSGSQLFINVGPGGTADRVAVVRSAPNATDGLATLGGRVVLSPVPGTFFNRRNTGPFTILTAEGGLTGTFTAPTAISAILRPRFIYTANSASVAIDVLTYASVVDTSNPNRASFATLLDQNANVAGLTGLYDVLDLVQTAAELNSILNGLAPRTEALRTSMAIAITENQSRVVRERLSSLQTGNLGGRMAYYGRRIETAALSLSGMDIAGSTMSDVSIQPVETETRLPESMSGFLSVGYLHGESEGQGGALGNEFDRDKFDGFYGVAGLEMEVGANGVIGGAVSYTNSNGQTFTGGGDVDTTLIQGSIYGKAGLGNVYVDGQISVGQLQFDGTRLGNFPGNNITLSLDDDAMAFSGEVGVGTFIGGQGLRIGPRVSVRYSQINFDDVAESGGLTALGITREEYRSIQGRAGLVISGNRGALRPLVSATYVHDFEEQPTTFGANFIGGTGAPVLFGLTSDDQDWAEVSGGFTYDTGRFQFSLSADTTLMRDNVNNQSYRAGVKIRF